MTDSSFTGIFDNEIHYLLRKIEYDGYNFHLLDLSSGNKAITGNKAWKLKYNLQAYHQSGANHLLTFGGAYSNHIYQTAKLGHHLDIPTIGVIRGAVDDAENRMLRTVEQWGMSLVGIDRATYRKRVDADYLADLAKKYDAFIIPEGGTNVHALRGTTELGQMVNDICDQYGIMNIAVPVGTGGTMAGIINGLKAKKVQGYGALKGDFLTENVKEWVVNDDLPWEISDDSEFGGYAKWNDDLIEFIISFHKKTGIVLDPIYTGKMMYRAHKANLMTSSWLYIHTGGIQGNYGFNQRFDLDLPTS